MTTEMLNGFEEFQQIVDASENAEIDFITAARRGDLGSVEAFCEFARGRLVWDRDAGVWYYRDKNNLWKQDATKSIACQITGRIIDDFMLFMENNAEGIAEEYQQHMWKWSNRLTSNAGREGMLRMAKGTEHMWVDASSWDPNPFAINFPNGLLDVKTGEFRPAEGADLLTKMAKVLYDPSATCPLWLQTLNEVFNYDEALISYLQRCLGYTILGLPNGENEQKFFLCHGPLGGNGKNTIMDPIMTILGGYAGTAGEDTFNQRDGVPEDLHDLRNTRMILASEPGQRTHINEEMLKAITGNKEVRTRKLYENSIVWQPRFCVWMLANKYPRMPNSNSLFRRFVVIPFRQTFTGPNKKVGLGTRLSTEEGPGIMNWLIEGARRWIDNGLDNDVPDAVVQSHQDFRESTDIILGFLNEEVDANPEGVETQMVDVFVRYQVYCKDNGYMAYGRNRFYTEIVLYGVTVETKGGARITRDFVLKGTNGIVRR